MYIFIGLTYVISSLHLVLALINIILGITSQIREPIWMAHSISPLWSGVFVRRKNYSLDDVNPFDFSLLYVEQQESFVHDRKASMW